jgi:hypothetical protein
VSRLNKYSQRRIERKIDPEFPHLLYSWLLFLSTLNLKSLSNPPNNLQ